MEAGWGPGFRAVRQLTEGTTAPALLVEREGHLFVAKRAALTEASAAWQATLLSLLHDQGLRVPLLIPSLDGAFSSAGWVLMTHIDGRPPVGDDDWAGVRRYLDVVHNSTRDWTARPDMPAVVQLLQEHSDLRPGMSAEVQSLLRRAWSAITESPTSVVHGDPNEHNVLMTPRGPALVDWEESRVDFSVLDYAGLPGGNALGVGYAASVAWEVYLFWERQSPYLLRRLAELEGLMT